MTSPSGERTAVGELAATPAAGAGHRRVGRIVFWVAFGLAAALLVAGVAATLGNLNRYSDSSTAMQDTLPVGGKLLVLSHNGPRRGDVVLFRRPGSSVLFVKRLIGLPGDHVACCDARGRVSVNGRPLDETYVYPGNAASTVRFSVTLRKGQMWVMGDHRSISLDSREWGPVPLRDVVGRVVAVSVGRSFRVLRTPRTFIADGLAPRDSRIVLPATVLAASCGLVALVALTIFGIIRSVIRRRRSRRAASLA
jgi:signal peptidase I